MSKFSIFPTKADRAQKARAKWGDRGTAGASFAASLTFENIARRYGDKIAIEDFSLKVAPSEVICLLGPSGGGKTTLLRLAAGVERPTEGRVLIDDKEVAGPTQFVPPEKRGVGLMFQDFALFPHLSIIENVAFGLKSLPKADARQVAEAALTRVGLAHYANEYPHILSGGEQQRVALARAIAPRPSILLMDEPFSGLDIQLRQSIQEETRAILKETRATAIIVTHNSEEALRMGDRIAVMNGGRLLQVGTAETLYHTPSDLFVARMFSKINEIPGVVVSQEVATPLGIIEAPRLPDGAMVTVGIRHRAIHITNETGGLRARVLTSKFLGDATSIELAVEGLDEPLTMRTSVQNPPAIGENLAIATNPSDALIFPSN